MTNHPNRSKVRDWPAYVRAFRVRHKLTQKGLADKLGISERNVQQIEAGHRSPAPYLKRALRDLAMEITTSRQGDEHAPGKRKR